MRILTCELNPFGQFGPELVLSIAGLAPDEPAAHTVLVPLVCLPDRRQREEIAPCQEGHADCTCAVCPCCTEAIEVVLAEHFARLNPARLGEIDQALAERLARIGGVPGRTYCEDCRAIEPIGAHQAPSDRQLISIAATGRHVHGGGS